MPAYIDVDLLIGPAPFKHMARRLEHSALTIGRDYANDIVCSDPAASAKHGTIFHNNVLKYRDHSSNGTYCRRDGSRLYLHQDGIELQERDVLLIGELEVIMAKIMPH